MVTTLRIILYVIIVVIAVEVAIYLVMRYVRGQRRSKKYVQIVRENYRKSGVLATLDIAAQEFPKRSIERDRIEAACGYLYTSVLKDYKTAFNIIEQGFLGKDVHRINQKILKNEQEKANAVYLIPEPERVAHTQKCL